ncbi:DUF1810 domain-containing protein [Pikeienuella sp. HZG-20]|uniref:DUF1810 domain-containing protein n=1 Tax=Paludibacillus litoralis TaxID=3133267 RepID=UPI0030EDCB95
MTDDLEFDDDDDDIDLERFLAQQNEIVRGETVSHIERAMAELRAGRKRSHWMWFVFPQCDGVPEYHGRKPSEMTLWFGVAGLPEAEAYLADETLGARLRDCFGICLAGEGRDAEAIFGPVDAAKFRACATLFSRVEGADPVFASVLDAFFGGEPCPATLALTAGAACAR